MLLLGLLYLVDIAIGLSAICFGSINIRLPVRYLYIQIQENNQNSTSSIGKLDYTIQGNDCRFNSELIDREDGSYVLRFRELNFCENIQLDLSFKGIQLCSSPMIIQNDVKDGCNCPLEHNDWIAKAKCDKEDQIEESLKSFQSINFTKVLERSQSLWGQPMHARAFAFCHYQIISNQIYRKCYGEYVGFHTFVDKALASILSITDLPNTEFIFNLGDYPLASKDLEDKIPVISWCGSKDYNDLVVPTYFLAEYHINQNIQSNSIHSIGVPSINWLNKSSKVVFRGRDSNQLRIELASKSLKQPDILDVGITTYFFYHDDSNPPTKTRIEFNDFFKFRYILSIDGTVAAYRLPLLLAGNSIILKSDSKYFEHFYSKLTPFKHYVPFNSKNFDNVISTLRSLDHEKILKEMKQFNIDHLQSKNFYCYYIQLLKEYTAKLEHPPKKPSHGLELLTSTKVCKCKYKKSEL